MNITWTNTSVKLGDLKPWQDNPKYSSKAQAKRILDSWQKFGQVMTVAVSPTLDVYDGHQRLSVLLTLYGGDYVVDARQSNRHLTDEERRAMVLALTNATGSWNWDSLAGWKVDELKGWGFDKDTLKGWKSDVTALNSFLDSEKPAKDAPADVDRAGELLEKWGVVLGDLWQIGDHRLICGDCTDAAVVARVMGGEMASITFTSPPYNAGDNSLGGNKSMVDSKYIDSSDDKPQDEYLKLLVDFTELALNYSEYAVIDLQQLSGNKIAVIEYLYHFRNRFADRAVWFKGYGQPAMAKNVMNSRFEDLFIFACDENPTRAIKTGNFHGTVPNVYEGRGASGENEAKAIHAATMPLHLAEFVIGTFSDGGVYEPFLGSGTTMVASENLQRTCYASELSPAYVAVALERMAQAFPSLEIKRL